MLRTYKYRLYPTDEQKWQFENHFNVCRLIWNLALEVKKTAWQSARINISRYDLQKQLVGLKKEYQWLYDINAQSLQSVLLNLDNAYKGFFRGNGFPKFKKKLGEQNFQCPSNTRRIDFDNELLTIPKIKNIPIILSKKFEGKIKTVIISKTKTNKYFASILVETEQDILAKPKTLSLSKIIGLDVGIKSFVISSDGRTFEPNRKLKENLKRLQILQRRTSKKKKGSNNRKKANLKVAILYEKITNQRADYIHKITHALTHDNQVESIVIEDLNIVGMLKNRKLAQAIGDVSWGEFFRQLKYKCKWNGKNLIIIDRFEPTSKKCFDCKELNHELTLRDREWTCSSCGMVHDRDLNAAKNIRMAGIIKYCKTYSGSDRSGVPVE